MARRARSSEDRNEPPSGIPPEAFRFPKLRAAASAEHFDLHIAALEWSLDAPITIRGEADIQSRRQWEDKLEPYAHQIRNLLTFCRKAPVTLLADDVGLGKTISAGLVLSECMVRRKVSRALVVAPKLLLPQWQEELAVKFGIAAETATGAHLASAVRRNMPVVVTTYHSIRSYLDDIRRANFDMLILDEAHKLRNLHGTAQPPQFAVGVRKALADRVFKYVLMLTATPIQNRLWDLYSLIDLLTAAKGHSNPLGSPAQFKTRYIADSRAVQIRRGHKEEFRRHLSSYIVRTRRSDAKLVFPTRRVRTHRVPATDIEIELLRAVGELLREQSLNGLSQSSIGQALMSSPHALAAQLQNMAERGTVPQELALRVRSLVSDSTVSGKLQGLSTLISELSRKRPEDWRVVVFTSRAETQRSIGRHLKTLGIPTGFIAGSRAHENDRAIRAFREAPPGVRVLVSTDAGAEGINLQVANVLVNFDLPWNPMVLEQRIGRIQRLASAHAEVTVLNLVLAGSVEETVVARLGEKLQAISESLGDIEGILESTAGADDEGDSFEVMIRKLVVDSLRGVNVEEATRRALKSIEEAKEIFEAERDTVERTLGNLQDLHRSGPRVPEITPIVPSIDAREFVLRALARDGAHIRPIDGDVLAVTMPGHNEFRVTFKERAVGEADELGFFGGNLPRLFIPGKRDFERLAQSWAEKASSLVIDRSNPEDHEIEQLLAAWLANYDGIDLADFGVLRRDEGFCGELICRASMAVAHDRLEKLVTVPIQSGAQVDVEPAGEGERPTPSECDTSSLDPELPDLVTAAIGEEPDLTKFSEFYAKRLEEELPAASDATRQRRIREQFSPAPAADAVAVRGVRYAVLHLAAQLRVDGEGPYPAEFAITPGAADGAAVVPESEWVPCQETDRTVPVGALETCGLTGKRVLRHLLGRSASSGRWALRGLMVRCEESDELLLPDEVDLCTVTGRTVRKGVMIASAVSGRLALPMAMAMCEVTGAAVLPEELAVSAISGRRFRSDEAGESALSGRVGHVSELVSSVLPEGQIARDEAAQSDMSGAWAGASELVRSQRPPGRWGLPSEMARSDVSGRLVLQDELEASDVSGKRALPEELMHCEITGSRCLPEELTQSQWSGQRYRRDQQATSCLSGKSGHQSEFVSSVDPPGLLAMDEAEQSQVSGTWVKRGRLSASDVPPHRRALADELVESAVSGRRALPDEVERSKISGEPALPGELVTCEFSGDRVLPTEAVRSDVSGKVLRADLAQKSAHSGRVGHPDECVEAALPSGLILKDEVACSDLSGAVAAQELLVASSIPPHRLGLPTEMIESAVSGIRVLRDEAELSAVSGASALPHELRSCEFTGAHVLPSELSTSDVSGKKYRGDQQSLSVLSKRRGHTSEFVKSVAPSGWIAVDEAAQSSISGEWGAKAMLTPSARPPHRLGLAHELVTCELTGQRLLRDEAASSVVSGKLVDSALLVASAVSGKLAIAEEMVVCEATGARVLPEESGICAITGKRVALRELERSEVSGRSGIRSLMVKCAESGTVALPSETVRCELTGQLVLSTLTEACDVTGRRGLTRLMQHCPTGGKAYISDSASQQRMSALVGTDTLLTPCRWTGRLMLSHRLEPCAITGMRVDPAELNTARELKSLRALLDGVRVEGALPFLERDLQWLRSTEPELRHAQDAIACKSADGTVVIAAVRAKAGLLGLAAAYYAVATLIGKTPAMICKPVAGKRTPGGWIAQSR